MNSTTTERQPLATSLIVVMAFACGAMVANLYYAQTLLDSIAPAIGLSSGMEGAIVTLTQLGYGLGLALLVPLGDLVENRRLILISVAGTAIGCIGIATAQGPATFLAASVITGVCATGAQVLVPLAATLSSGDRQGRTIGMVMSGLLTGVMLARPAASFVAALAGWRAIFYASSGLMVVIGIVLAISLPRRVPSTDKSYPQIIGSLLTLARSYRQLRRRAAYQGAMFFVFNLFWTVAPLVLLREFGMTQTQVALFALAGAGGALAAPVAGALADRGFTRALTLTGTGAVAAAMLAADLAVAARSVVIFAITAIVVDAAVQMSQITGQKIIFALDGDARARLNAAYMTTMFVVGALGSLAGGFSYTMGGWPLTAIIGAGVAAMTLAATAYLDRA
ncbi:MAG: MFS transporter [Sphingomonas sp. 28-66-16]|nr:MAG: MFS transporter [Sphingomonas sp. 28-66-16]